jgi:hypothetical protein
MQPKSKDLTMDGCSGDDEKTHQPKWQMGLDKHVVLGRKVCSDKFLILKVNERGNDAAVQHP